MVFHIPSTRTLSTWDTCWPCMLSICSSAELQPLSKYEHANRMSNIVNTVWWWLWQSKKPRGWLGLFPPAAPSRPEDWQHSCCSAFPYPLTTPGMKNRWVLLRSLFLHLMDQKVSSSKRCHLVFRSPHHSWTRSSFFFPRFLPWSPAVTSWPWMHGKLVVCILTLFGDLKLLALSYFTKHNFIKVPDNPVSKCSSTLIYKARLMLLSHWLTIRCWDTWISYLNSGLGKGKGAGVGEQRKQCQSRACGWYPIPEPVSAAAVTGHILTPPGNSLNSSPCV